MDEFRRSVRPDRISELPIINPPTQSIEECRRKVLQVVDDALNSLLKIYAQAGYSQLEMSVYLVEFSQLVSHTCNAEIVKENEILELGKKEIEKFQAEIRSLLTALGRKESSAYSQPSDNYNDQINTLRDQVETLLTEKQEKLQDIRLRRSRVEALAEELGEGIDVECEAEDISEKSFARIGSLYNYYTELKSKRQKKILQVYTECYKVYEELALYEEGFGCVQLNSQHKRIDDAVVAYFENGVEPALNVHIQELGVVEERWNALLREKANRRNELASLGERIAKLWNHLKVDDSERHAFQQSFDMKLSQKTIVTGKTELLRLRRLRAASLSRHLSELRRSMLRLWEESGLAETTRIGEFPIFFLPADEIDDDMVSFVVFYCFFDCSQLEEHEGYYLRLRERVEELRPILLKIQSREALVEDRIELERLQLNPDRLKNRSANAFAERKREETMVKGVRTLDRVTAELVGMIEEWEGKYGSFVYHGNTYKDVIAGQEAVYSEVNHAFQMG